MRAVGPHSLARTGHAQVAADVSRRHLTNEPNAPTDGRVAQVPRELEGSARCRFPLLLWRRGTGRGGRRSPSACQIDWCRNPLECCPNHSIEHGASSPQLSPPREERGHDLPVSEIFGCLGRGGTPRPIFLLTGRLGNAPDSRPDSRRHLLPATLGVIYS